jgi:putative transposase
MELWRADFNTQRRHEALGQRCLASVYQLSARPYSDLLSGWDYPSDHHKRRVNKDGYIKWQDQRLYLSEASHGEDAALSRRDGGEWMSRFRSFDLAVLEDESGLLRCYPGRWSKALPTSPVAQGQSPLAGFKAAP